MKGTISHTHIYYPPPPGSRVCMEKEINNSHLEFFLSSRALLVPPLLEVWVLEEQYIVTLRQKSFHTLRSSFLILKSFFITRAFFSEGQRSTLSIPDKLVHPIFRIQ